MINNNNFDRIKSPDKKNENKIDEEIINKIALEYVDQLDLKFNSS